MTILTKAEMHRRDALLTPEGRQQQDQIARRIGIYMTTWANVESLLIGILGSLLGVSKANAEVIYTALPSVHARRTTIVALARQNLSREEAGRVVHMMTRFKTETSIRNSYAHCEYSLNAEGYITSTIHYDLENLDRGKPVWVERPLDRRRIDELDESLRRLMALYDEMRVMAYAPPAPPATHPA